MSKYDSLYESDEEENTTAEYGKCTKQKSLNAYFKLRATNRFVDSQLKRLNNLVAQAILVDRVGCKLFKKFLYYDSYTKKSNLVRVVDCYLLCDEMLSMKNLMTDEYRLCYLSVLSRDKVFERKIERAVNHDYKYKCNYAMSKTKEVIRELKKECLEEIECHEDYSKFNSEILSQSRRIKHYLKEIYESER